MLKSNLKSSVSKIGLPKSFSNNENGNVAMIFALALIPILFAVGISIDYTRSLDAQTAMQVATDAAALAAALDADSTPALKLARVKDSVAATMRQKSWIHYDPSNITLDMSNGYTVAMSGKIDTSILAALGFNAIDAGSTSTAMAGPQKKMELALALDNTGSMKDKLLPNGKYPIEQLKIDAQWFTDALFAKAPNRVKVGIVPFVAVVNPGLDYINKLGIADFKGDADYHGYYLSAQKVVGACDGGAISGYGTGTSTNTNGWLEDVHNPFSTKFSYIYQELLGVKAAHAQVGGGTTTPTNYDSVTAWPLQTSKAFGPGAPDGIISTIKAGEVQAPNPSGVAGTDYQFTLKDNGCSLHNPIKINHFDLLARTGSGGVPWKGCVMARSGGHDVDDVTPDSSDPSTLFVPFFWPSEMVSVTPKSDGGIHYGGVINAPHTDASTMYFNNNYLNYVPMNTPFNSTYKLLGYEDGDPGAGFADILKYNGTNNQVKYSDTSGADFTSPRAMVNENPGSDGQTWGPNKACPEPVTPLTNVKSTIDKAIQNMSIWNGGGTVTSEGLMWAWRVLSPELPYGTTAVGAVPYTDDTVQKYIVLMTDGVNNLDPNGLDSNRKFLTFGSTLDNASNIESDHTAYGAIWSKKTFAPQVVGLDNKSSKSISRISQSDFGTGDTANDLLNDRFSLACENAKNRGIKVFVIYYNHGYDNATAAAKAEDYLSSCGDGRVGKDGKYPGLKGSSFYVSTDSLQPAFEKILNSIASNVRLTK